MEALSKWPPNSVGSWTKLLLCSAPSHGGRIPEGLENSEKLLKIKSINENIVIIFKYFYVLI